MAFPTAVNSQITDAVTQANVKVVGEAPAQVTSDRKQNAEESELGDEPRPEADRSGKAER